MEAMLSGGGGDDSMHQAIAVPTQSPPFSVKSAFSPLVPPGVFNTAAAIGRYPTLFQQHQQQQQHAKRFLSAPYSGTGFLSTIIQSESGTTEHTDPNGNTAISAERCGSAGESQE